MSLQIIPATPRFGPDYSWLNRIFTAKAAQAGQTVRRSELDIIAKVGWPTFFNELDRRGFHAVENSGQVIIFCNNAPVRVLR